MILWLSLIIIILSYALFVLGSGPLLSEIRLREAPSVHKRNLGV